MAILGLLLLLSAAGLAVDMVLQNTASIGVEALGLDFSLSSGWLFVAGVATGVIGLLGLSMLLAGMSRARRRRATLAESRDNLQGLQAERDRLAVELERERAARTTTAGQRRNGPALDEEESLIDLDDKGRSDEPSGEHGRHGLFSRRH